jgi:hypothetical protein
MKTTVGNPESRCPACLKTADAHTDPLSDESPRGGDISCCLHCGCVCVYQSDLTLRAMRQDEIDLLEPKARRLLDVTRLIVAGFQQSQELKDIGREYGIDWPKGVP